MGSGPFAMLRLMNLEYSALLGTSWGLGFRVVPVAQKLSLEVLQAAAAEDASGFKKVAGAVAVTLAIRRAGTESAERGELGVLRLYMPFLHGCSTQFSLSCVTWARIKPTIPENNLPFGAIGLSFSSLR